MKKSSTKIKKKISPFNKLIINELEILRENLGEASKWIALTEKGAPLMKISVDDFYQACLYIIGKAYSRAAGCIDDDSITLEELQHVLSTSSASDIVKRMLGEAFITYLGNGKYVLNYPRLKEILEAVDEVARTPVGNL